MLNLAENFKNLRTVKGISVYQLSKDSDVSENYIRTIEKGTSQPSVAILDRLLSCLGVTLSEFFNDDREAMYPSAFERELVETIRTLEEEKAQAVLQVAKLFTK